MEAVGWTGWGEEVVSKVRSALTEDMYSCLWEIVAGNGGHDSFTRIIYYERRSRKKIPPLISMLQKIRRLRVYWVAQLNVQLFKLRWCIAPAADSLHHLSQSLSTIVIHKIRMRKIWWAPNSREKLPQSWLIKQIKRTAENQAFLYRDIYKAYECSCSSTPLIFVYCNIDLRLIHYPFQIGSNLEAEQYYVIVRAYTFWPQQMGGMGRKKEKRTSSEVSSLNSTV